MSINVFRWPCWAMHHRNIFLWIISRSLIICKNRTLLLSQNFLFEYLAWCIYFHYFCSAACMTWDLAESGKDFVATIVNRNDLVPSLGIASAAKLRTEVPLSHLISWYLSICANWNPEQYWIVMQLFIRKENYFLQTVSSFKGKRTFTIAVNAGWLWHHLGHTTFANKFSRLDLRFCEPFCEFHQISCALRLWSKI